MSEPQQGENRIVREEIVATAVKFLKNPNVVNTPLSQKQTFLQRKGLTDEEIQLACERAGSYSLHEGQIAPAVPAPLRYRQSEAVGLFEHFKNIVHNLGVIGVVAYVIYLFYKKFIKPYLFGRTDKSVEENVDDLNKLMSSSIEDLKDSISSVKIEIDRLQRDTDSNTQRQLHDLKTEIGTVKGLLLSRKQFPSVSTSSVVPPSIPAWQLSSIQPETPEPDPDTADAKSEDADAKSEDLMEIISRDGSELEHSEHEHGRVTKTTSESSLEIMM